VKIFNPFRKHVATKALLAELLNDRRDHCRSERHIYALRNDLEPFTGQFPQLDRVGVADIAAYLRCLKVGPRRRDNVRNSIALLFRFARDRERLPDRKTAAEKVARIKPLVDVQTWTIQEADLLLQFASGHWQPCFALGLFAGLRTAEILRMEWSSLNFDMRVVAVGHRQSKTRTDRRLPMQDNLSIWLERYRGRVGPIYPGNFKTNENLHSLEMARIRKATGLPRKDNACRHSFGSYRLAVTKNFGQVALEMGNSERMVRQHYNDPKIEAEGAAYFDIMPRDRGKVVEIALGLEFR
jgi:integrase